MRIVTRPRYWPSETRRPRWSVRVKAGALTLPGSSAPSKPEDEEACSATDVLVPVVAAPVEDLVAGRSKITRSANASTTTVVKAIRMREGRPMAM